MCFSFLSWVTIIILLELEIKTNVVCCYCYLINCDIVGLLLLFTKLCHLQVVAVLVKRMFYICACVFHICCGCVFSNL